MNCVICGKQCGKNPHHIITRGAYGRDSEGYDVKENTIWLCQGHHTEVHTTGRETFFYKYHMTGKLNLAKQLKFDYDIKKGGR